jgi:ribosomal protein S18 acetylase RimI-like enzyme
MTMIRPALPNDAAAIARVQIETWRTAYRDVFPAAFLSELSVERRAASTRVIMERGAGTSRYLVAEEGGSVVGYCCCGPTRDGDVPGEAEVYAIYVLETAAGKGIGAALMTGAEAWMRERGYRAAGLWVLEGNAPARGFYERVGWDDTGQRKEEGIGGVTVREAKYRKEFD